MTSYCILLLHHLQLLALVHARPHIITLLQCNVPCSHSQGLGERQKMLDRFWDERIEDFDLRAKISMDDTLGVDEVRGVLQQVAEVTEGLSGRSLMQLMNGACRAY